MIRRILFAFVILMSLTGVSSAMAVDKKTAVFAGGCFWSMQKAFDDYPGVISTRAGFMGGKVKNPSYNDVGSETTGHLEAVEVIYDAQKISYEKLINHYWHNIDPLTLAGQFCDFAPSYHSAVFTYDDAQYQTALATKQQVAAELKKPVVTLVVKVSSLTLPQFYPAEDYHQHYARTHALAYASYALGCGRHAKLEAIWGAKAGN